MYRKISLGLALVLLVLVGKAQNASVSGQILDVITNAPLVDYEVRVSGENIQSYTNFEGKFNLDKVPSGEQDLLFLFNGLEKFTLPIEVPSSGNKDLGKIQMSVESRDDFDELPTISLSGGDFDEAGNSNVSGILNASADVFVQQTRFSWGTRRFRNRGLDNRNQSVVVNGISVNDLEFGRPNWFLWSGLNDVTRASFQQYGIVPMEFSFGGLQGGTSLDLRASSQWKQTRISYSLANATYKQRVIATHSTGWMDNGFAFSVSGSRRVSQEGFIPGVFYDGYSYFAGISKKIGKYNQLHLNYFGANNDRGANGAAIQESYDLAGSNYYNPHWGFQNGKVRNSRVRQSHIPVAILTHDLNFKNGGKLTNSASFKTGRNGQTRLDWFNAGNPNADYYRRLPSFIEDPELSDRVAAALRNDESLRQLNWDAFYIANSFGTETIENADGIEGNTVTGKRSQYILEEQHYDPTTFDIQSSLTVPLTDDISFSGGVSYRAQKNENFKLINDLLGGDFYIDQDRFAIGNLDLRAGSEINNINSTKQLLEVGDTIGYNYNTEIRNMGAWWQFQGSTKKVDYFVASSLSRTALWRDGIFKNGKFPDDSFGESERAEFTNYGVKGGLTYKINGRNYIYLNGMSSSRAPFARNAFVSARTRNELIPTLTNENLWGAELSYLWRSPNLKFKASAYINEVNNRSEILNFFVDDGLSVTDGLFFGNFIISNIDQRHLGIELAAEQKLTSSLNVTAALSLGEYFYTDRFKADLAIDNQAQFVFRDRTVYSKNFFVDGTPQTAGKIGLAYRGKNYWSVYLDVSYMSNFWLDFSPIRRTSNAIEYNNGSFVERDSPLWEDIINQEKVDGFVLVDLSVRKSWRLWKKYFLIANLGMNNLLNNQNYITGGFEQLRFDFSGKNPDRFPSRYYYGLGLTYFANVTIRW